MRKIHLVESIVSWGEEGGKFIWWNVLCPGQRGRKVGEMALFADKCHATSNNYKLGPFLTKTPRCLGFLVFHILWIGPCKKDFSEGPIGPTPMERNLANFTQAMEQHSSWPWAGSIICQSHAGTSGPLLTDFLHKTDA